MIDDPIIAFLPCRSGSQRVVDKNIKTFSGITGGLTRIKIEQLISCSYIDQIIVSTDDERVVDVVEEVAKKSTKDIKIVERPPHLATSETSTDELIQYVPEIIKSGIVLWTHVTSPFVGAEIYTKAIQTYRKNIADHTHDSLMSVTKHQSFFWDENGPVNYDRAIEKWPRTQTLPEWFEANSAFFIADISVYIKSGDRIGKRPYLFELFDIETIDIDWESDFLLAENIWSSRNSNAKGETCC